MSDDKDSKMEQKPQYSSVSCHINLKKKREKRKREKPHTLDYRKIRCHGLHSLKEQNHLSSHLIEYIQKLMVSEI